MGENGSNYDPREWYRNSAEGNRGWRLLGRAGTRRRRISILVATGVVLAAFVTAQIKDSAVRNPPTPSIPPPSPSATR